MRAIMRSLVALSLFGAALFLPVNSVQAQSTTTSYPYCLLTGPDQECAFQSLAQCMASRHGNQDFCEPNNRFEGRSPGSGRGNWR